MAAQDDYSTVYQVARKFLARQATIGELRQAVRECEAREYRARLRAVRGRMQTIGGHNANQNLTR